MDSKEFNIAADAAVWKCKECGSVHSTTEWDESTLKMCTDRASKRGFKSLGMSSCRQNGSKRVYICPTCKAPVAGFHIKNVQEQKIC